MPNASPQNREFPLTADQVSSLNLVPSIAARCLFFPPSEGDVGTLVATDDEAGAVVEAAIAGGPQPASKRQFTFLEFMGLFTDAEQLAIAGAAMTDAPTKLWYDRAVGAQFISLDDARLTFGLDAMVGAGLLTEPRRDRVLQGLGPED